VVRAVLAGAEALANLVDPLEPGREQPLHLVLGRRDQVAVTGAHGVEVDLEAGARHQQRRLHLQEVALGEEPPHHGERPTARLEQREPPARQPGDLGRGPRVIAARERPHDDRLVDQVTGPPARLGVGSDVAALAAHDRQLAVDGEDAAAQCRRHVIWRRARRTRACAYRS